MDTFPDNLNCVEDMSVNRVFQIITSTISESMDQIDDNGMLEIYLTKKMI